MRPSSLPVHLEGALKLPFGEILAAMAEKNTPTWLCHSEDGAVAAAIVIGYGARRAAPTQETTP